MHCRDKEQTLNRVNDGRRDFLKLSLAGISSLLGSGAASALRAADTEGDYKAIVCILLEGGADVFNMVAPIEQDAWQKYREARPDIALERGSLLALNHQNGDGSNPLKYGMRENMGRMRELFNDKKLSIVANVGTLVRPLTKEELENGVDTPFELFAHNTQRAQWMYGDATGNSHTGWAARTADIFYPTPNPYFNVNVSDVGSLLQRGGRAEPIIFSEAYISPDTMRYYGFGPESGGSDFGNLYQDIYEAAQKSTNRLLSAFAKKRVRELERPNTLAALFDGVASFDGFGGGVHETGKPLGKQLELTAQILSIHKNFPGNRKRQIFYVVHHGWDTHDSDNEQQAGYLSDSLGAFNDALEQMGLQNSVTTITLSDFGRSLTSNGSGTDHGWGSYAFVTGGAVKGGEIYGRIPSLQKNSPDAWDGRVIPTISMEEYLATVVKWFGASQSELNEIFPNLKSFTKQDLGFMG